MSSQPDHLDDILVKSGLAEFTRNIKLGKFERSYEVAKRTVEILHKLVEENSWPTARQLIDTLKGICAYIDSLGLVETAAGNMTRRVMRIIRDECRNFNALQTANQEETLDSIRGESTETDLDLEMSSAGSVKGNILEGIQQEQMDESEDSSKSIAQHATDYVQSDEIILTLGKSKVIESFLKHAAKKGGRKFRVIVVELAPFYSGREMAKSLSESGIETLIIPDSAAFAIMSRVNKVIIGTQSMMANGGIRAPAGSHSIALAAKHFSVPLIVCCPMYKLTPEYLVLHDSAAFKQFSHLHAAFPEPYAPTIGSSVVGRQGDDNNRNDGDCSDIVMDRENLITNDHESTSPRAAVESLHSTFDYVPPELITLFVSDVHLDRKLPSYSPSYVYQLLNELYCKSDYLD